MFLLDPDFRIERPKRYYRHVSHLLDRDENESDKHEQSQQGGSQAQGYTLTIRRSNESSHFVGSPPDIHLSSPETDHKSLISSVRTRISKIFHHGSCTPSRSRETKADGGLDANASESEEDSNVSSTSLRSVLPSRAATPLLDPSTNTNPLQDDVGVQGKMANKLVMTDKGEKRNAGNTEMQKKTTSIAASAKKKLSTDVSKHTFYILNSQMRLKLFARNEVS